MRPRETWQRLSSIRKAIITGLAIAYIAIAICKPKFAGLIALNILLNESAIGPWHNYGYHLTTAVKISVVISGIVVSVACLAIPGITERKYRGPVGRIAKFLFAFAKMTERHVTLGILLGFFIFTLATTPVIPGFVWFGIGLGKVSPMDRRLLLGIVLTGNTLKHFAVGKFLELFAPFGSVRTQIYFCVAVATLSIAVFLSDRYLKKAEVSPCDAIDA